MSNTRDVRETYMSLSRQSSHRQLKGPSRRKGSDGSATPKHKLENRQCLNSAIAELEERSHHILSHPRFRLADQELANKSTHSQWFFDSFPLGFLVGGDAYAAADAEEMCEKLQINWL